MGGWQFGSMKPMGAPGAKGGPQIVVGETKTSMTRRAAGAAWKRHQGRTEQDRDRSRGRRAWPGDHAYGVAVAGLALWLLLAGAPWWVVALIAAAAMAIAVYVPQVAVPLRRRKLRREAVRAWNGDSRASGIAKGLGLESAGHLARLDRMDWDEAGDRVLGVTLPPGVTAAQVDAKRVEIGSALGAAFVEVKPAGFGAVTIALRQTDPLDGAERVSWAVSPGSGGQLGGSPDAWWENQASPDVEAVNHADEGDD